MQSARIEEAAVLEGVSLSVYVVSTIVCLTPIVIAMILSRAHPARSVAGVLYDAEQSGKAR